MPLATDLCCRHGCGHWSLDHPDLGGCKACTCDAFVDREQVDQLFARGMAPVPSRDRVIPFRNENAGVHPWHDTRTFLPEDGMRVEVTDAVGHTQNLRLREGAWWLDDYSLRVSYTPKQWRYRWRT